MTTRMDLAATYTMAQSAILEPPGPTHVIDESPYDQYQDTATILKRVIAEQNGTTNPTHRAVLFLLELRDDLEHRYSHVDIRHEPRHISQDIDNAMHLSANFLQDLTDLDGAFALTVLPCLDMADHIQYLVAVADKTPDGIAKIKRIRASQLVSLRLLQERWEDMLETARGFDESVTFRRLSDIVESTEDTVADAWFHATDFIDSCEVDVPHRSRRFSLATPNKPSYLQPTAATEHTGYATSHVDSPEPTVPHHTPTTDVSRVNTPAAVCATIALHEIPHDEASPPTPSPKHCNLSTANDTENPPYTDWTDIDTASLYKPPSTHQDRGGDVTATDLTENPKPVTNHYLNEFIATLAIQMRRVDEEKNNANNRIVNKATLIELESLMAASSDTIGKAAQTPTSEPMDKYPLYPAPPRRTTHTPGWTWPMSRKRLHNNDESRPLPVQPIRDPQIILQHDGTRENSTEGIFNIGAIRTEDIYSRSIYYSDKYDPKSTTIVAVPDEKRATIRNAKKKHVTEPGEDHNWRGHLRRKCHTKKAVFERIRPNSKPGKTRKAIVNNHTTATTTSVRSQTSKRTDVRQTLGAMNNFIKDDLRTLHESTWTKIHDGRTPPRHTNATQEKSETEPSIAPEVVRRITTAYEVAYQAPKVRPPWHANGAHAPMEVIETNSPHANRAGIRATSTPTKGARAQAKYPRTRATLDTSASNASKYPAIENRQVRNRETTSLDLYTTSTGGARAEPIPIGGTPNRRPDVPLHPRNTGAEDDEINGNGPPQNPYCARDIVDDSSVIFLDWSDSTDESGVGDCSISSTTASSTSSRIGGRGYRGKTTRPLSYILMSNGYYSTPGSPWINERPDYETCKSGVQSGIHYGCNHSWLTRETPSKRPDQTQRRPDRTDVTHTPGIETNTRTYPSSNTSAVATYHRGASNPGLHGHPRMTKEKSDRIIQKWMKTYDGRPKPTSSDSKSLDGISASGSSISSEGSEVTEVFSQLEIGDGPGDTDWNVDKYKNDHEPKNHWALRRQFMVLNKDRYPEDRLVSLSQVYANTKFLGCQYPQGVMDVMEESSLGLIQGSQEEEEEPMRPVDENIY